MGAQTTLKKLYSLSLKTEEFVAPVFYFMAILATIASMMIILLIGASVTMRYLTFTPFRFTEELVGLLMTAAARRKAALSHAMPRQLPAAFAKYHQVL